MDQMTALALVAAQELRLHWMRSDFGLVNGKSAVSFKARWRWGEDAFRSKVTIFSGVNEQKMRSIRAFVIDVTMICFGVRARNVEAC